MGKKSAPAKATLMAQQQQQQQANSNPTKLRQQQQQQQQQQHRLLVARRHCFLGGCFKYFLFSSLLGEMIQFDYYFSKGLKPPTSFPLKKPIFS